MGVDDAAILLLSENKSMGVLVRHGDRRGKTVEVRWKVGVEYCSGPCKETIVSMVEDVIR